MNDLRKATERGTKAWADVPDATEWVEELRGYDAPQVTPEVTSLNDPTLSVIQMQQAVTKIQNEMRETGNENLDTILLLSSEIRQHLAIVQEWVIERKDNWR